jgi:PAS domain S-box-containing protein
LRTGPGRADRLERAAEALRDSERRTRIVTDNIPVLIAYVDREHRYRFTNRAYQETMRTTPAQTEGRHVAQVLGEARYRRLLPYVEAVLAGTPQSFEIEFPTNDAQIEMASGTYLPHFDAQGQVVGFFLLYVDITHRQRAEEALRVANDSHERRVAQRTAELEAAPPRAEEANLD